jgi:HAD superfamily hydrolase (TIGR01509 family)
MALVVFFLAITASIILIGSSLNKKKLRQPQHDLALLHPKDLIIAFDIHDVLFTLDYVKIPYVALRSKHLYTLIKHALNPYVLADVYRLWRNNTVSEKYFIYLTTQYPGLAHCLPIFITLVNTQKPIKPMIELITTLKQRGYTLHIFSNIGEQTIADLQRKFPTIFEHFDVMHVASADNDYLGKPHAPAFERYLLECNRHNKAILFIDDKERNITAAQHHGIIGLQFITFKKLKQDLHLLGIIIE